MKIVFRGAIASNSRRIRLPNNKNILQFVYLKFLIAHPYKNKILSKSFALFANYNIGFPKTST